MFTGFIKQKYGIALLPKKSIFPFVYTLVYDATGEAKRIEADLVCGWSVIAANSTRETF